MSSGRINSRNINYLRYSLLYSMAIANKINVICTGFKTCYRLPDLRPPVISGVSVSATSKSLSSAIKIITDPVSHCFFPLVYPHSNMHLAVNTNTL